MANNKKRGNKRSNKKTTKSDDKKAPSGTITTVPMEENVNIEQAKQTREKVASLEHSKEPLQTKLTQSNSENEALKTDLVRMADTAVKSEMERDVVVVFVGSQVTELEKKLAAQLEEIKNAFKMKENAVEEMRRQVEFLQNSVAVAQQKKSFWAILSYATTLIAAISVAYITRRR